MTPELKSHMEDIRLGRKKKRRIITDTRKERTVHREIKRCTVFYFRKNIGYRL